MAIVNRNEFADLVGKSAKWVGEWIKDGMPTEGGGGRGKAVMIDTVKAIDWLISREVTKQVGDEEDDGRTPRAGTKDGEELLLTQAKRRKAEVDAAKAEESVIGLEDVGQFLYLIATLYGNELNGLGARLAPEVATIDDPAKCKNRVDVETRRIRAATADRISGFVSEYRAQRCADDKSATAEECR